MNYSDEVNYGYTSVRSAMAMWGVAEKALNDIIEMDGDDAPRAKAAIPGLRRAWSPLIQKLAQQGAQFGYTGWGPGSCGVSYVELVVIEAKIRSSI